MYWNCLAETSNKQQNNRPIPKKKILFFGLIFAVGLAQNKPNIILNNQRKTNNLNVPPSHIIASLDLIPYNKADNIISEHSDLATGVKNDVISLFPLNTRYIMQGITGQLTAI